MESVVLVIHLILALAIIVLVLLQRSEGGGLGIGGGGGGIGGLASARGTANALTKLTGICAAAFFVTSLTLGVLAGQKSRVNTGILENVDVTTIEAPVSDDDISAPSGIVYTPPSESALGNDAVKAIKDITADVNKKLETPKPVAPEPSAPTE